MGDGRGQVARATGEEHTRGESRDATTHTDTTAGKAAAMKETACGPLGLQAVGYRARATGGRPEWRCVMATGGEGGQRVGLEGLQERVRAFNEARDWGRYHSPRNLAMALVVEAGELLELYLWSSDQGPQPPVESRRPKVADEAADVMICLLNLCDRAGVDLEQAVLAKLERNAEKYPVQTSRGRLEKSTEL